MVSATLQTPQYPILLLPWLCFRVAALQTEGFGAGHAPAPLACTPPSRFPCLRIHPPPPRAIALSSPRPFAVPPVPQQGSCGKRELEHACEWVGWLHSAFPVRAAARGRRRTGDSHHDGHAQHRLAHKQQHRHEDHRTHVMRVPHPRQNAKRALHLARPGHKRMSA